MNDRKPLILVTNDDGYQAKGIVSLTEAMRDLGEVVVFVDNPEHTHPLSGIKSRIQKESIFSLNPDLCQISTKRSNNM